MSKKRKAARPRVTKKAPVRRGMKFVAMPHLVAPGDVSDHQIRKLLHEVQVHSEEITVQNEHLLESKAELERARDRYADLFDFAPIGYVSINARAVIADINLAGATLLGRPRNFVLNMPLSTQVVPEDLGALRAFLVDARDSKDGGEVRADLRVRRIPGRIIRLLARPSVSTPGPHLLAVMIDVTEEHRSQLERSAATDRVKALLNRLVSIQEEERRRMARNLHDHLGQQFTALRLTLGSLKERPLADSEFDRRIERADRLAEAIDKDVDFLVWELRPPALDVSGLGAALDQYLKEWSATCGIATEFHVTFPAAVRLPPGIDMQLYRIVQEALQNVRKHSDASTVSIVMEHRLEELRVIIEDDGRGFDVARARDRQGDTGSLGLVSMEERAALFGGSVEIESKPGQGTSVFVRAPTARLPPPR